MLASLIKVPAFQIDETEAKTLAQAIGRVSRHYDTKISAKTLDHLALAQVAAMIYAPRILALSFRRKPVEAPAQPPAPMFDLSGFGKAA